MAKLWPVLVIAAAAIAAGVLLFGADDGGGVMEEDEIVRYDEQGNPILMTSDAPRRPKKTPKPLPAPEDQPKPDTPEGVLLLEGVVLDAESKSAIAKAVLWIERAEAICPRLPTRPMTAPRTSTDAEGRFRLTVDRSPGRVDIFVDAKGHVLEALCEPAPGSKVTVLMRRALKQKVWVTDLHGRPVDLAVLKVVPAEGTSALPGHAGHGITNRGQGVIDGLVAGEVMLEVDHPAFMPTTIGPFDPATSDELAVKLAPAFRLLLVIRSDDASEVKNPTLAWQTNGTPPHRGLELLTTKPAGPDNAPLSEVHAEPVRIACDHREVRFEVKADGFEPWMPPAEPLPVEGGERKIIASLRRDASLGSLTIRVEDSDGKPVNYAAIQAVPDITRLDERAISSGIVLETAETLNFPAIPAGPYRIGIRTPQYAPGEVEVIVRPGEKTEVTLKLEQPAKLRIKFVSNERTLVRFRLMKDGRLIPAFPEGVAPNPNESGTPPLVVQGNEGTIFTGLPSGPLVIQVTSADLVASPQTVHLRAGEVTETEIQVRFR